MHLPIISQNIRPTVFFPYSLFIRALSKHKMQCKAGVFFASQEHEAGDLVTGFVVLQISASVSVESISLSVDRESGIEIEEMGKEKGISEKAVRHLGRFVVYKERSKRLQPGIHRFPFSFRMMQNEGPSISFKRILRGRKITVMNKYISRCEIRIYGIFKPVARVDTEILVREKTQLPSERIRHHQNLSSCFCFQSLKSSMSVICDSVFASGAKHKIEIFGTPSVIIQDIQPVLELSISPFGNTIPPVILHFKCNLEKQGSLYLLHVDPLLPASTRNTDVFSISYTLYLNISIRGNSSVNIKQKIIMQSLPSTNPPVPLHALNAPEAQQALDPSLDPGLDPGLDSGLSNSVFV